MHYLAREQTWLLPGLRGRETGYRIFMSVDVCVCEKFVLIVFVV